MRHPEVRWPTIAGSKFNGSPLPASTWAGPITMALTAERRRLNYTLAGNVNADSPLNHVSSLEFTMYRTPTGSENAVLYPDGVTACRSLSESVSEVAYEFDAPQLKSKRLVRRLSLDAAARFNRWRQPDLQDGA